jgi:hypothetical protein
MVERFPNIPISNNWSVYSAGLVVHTRRFEALQGPCGFVVSESWQVNKDN